MDCTKWMSRIDGEKSISELCIPGTHNSCARYIALPFWCKCQDKSIAEQLNLGVRFFDIRLEMTGERLKLVHSVIDCRPSPAPFKKLYFDDVFAQFSDFIKNNPSEAVLVCIALDDGREQEAMLERFFEDFVEPHRDMWFTQNRLPLLSECRGRLVLARRVKAGKSERFDADTAGIDATACYGASPPAGQAPVRVEVVSAQDGTVRLGVLLQDNFNIPPRQKWERAVIPVLKNSRADKSTLLINYLSANNGFNSPKKTADYVNARYLAYPLEPGMHGITVTDYVTRELAEKIIGLNLGREESD